MLFTYGSQPPRQGPGEASAVVRDNGAVEVFYLYPGHGNAGQLWGFNTVPTAKDAVDLLNRPARQGPGEVSATVRDDDTVELLYLYPGSQGVGTQHTWQYRHLGSPAEAVNFLNKWPRQGRGEASLTIRDNGTVDLIYLAAGTASKGVWGFNNFSTATEAVNWLNQPIDGGGTGEVSPTMRDDGTVVLFFFTQPPPS